MLFRSCVLLQFCFCDTVDVAHAPALGVALHHAFPMNTYFPLPQLVETERGIKVRLQLFKDVAIGIQVNLSPATRTHFSTAEPCDFVPDVAVAIDFKEIGIQQALPQRRVAALPFPRLLQSID